MSTCYEGNNDDLKDKIDNLPKCFFSLHSDAKIENGSQALSVLLHSCMLDVGYIPLNIDADQFYTSMPKNWKTAGALKFQYYHKTCPDLCCWMTCIPLFSHVSIHGLIDGGSSNNIRMTLKITKYVREINSFTEIEHLFKKTKAVVKKLKDEICFPLLASLQEKAGCDPSFGLNVTVDEVKLYIMKLLPIKSVVSLAKVNKDFHRISKSPLLWKHLIERDFKLPVIPSNSSVDTLKELYKREYLKEQRRKLNLTDIFQPNYPILPMDPRSCVDFRRDLDPALQLAFPHLRDRFRPNYLFPRHDYPDQFM